MPLILILIIVLSNIVPTLSWANCWWKPPLCCDNPEKIFANQFYLGPEIYYVNRKRDNGTSQKGAVYGVRGGYERVKRYKFYIGIDALYGEGRLFGKAGSGSKLKSRFIDRNIEGRVGYTFQQKSGYRFLFTPFIGGGYSTETNNYMKPSPLQVHFQLRYSYVCGGFLSQVTFRPKTDFGVNFKLRYMVEGKNHVTHDPDYDDNEMIVKEEFHYRVELPLTYRRHPHFWIRFEPFYEFRHFGGQMNYPFDFYDTKLNIYGATLKFMYCL